MITVEQYADTMARWAPVLVAAGMWDDRYHPEDVYFIAGAIIHDEELGRTRYAMAQAMPTNPQEPSVLPSCADALALWTDDQKAALKARIVHKLGARDGA